MRGATSCSAFGVRGNLLSSDGSARRLCLSCGFRLECFHAEFFGVGESKVALLKALEGPPVQRRRIFAHDAQTETAGTSSSQFRPPCCVLAQKIEDRQPTAHCVKAGATDEELYRETAVVKRMKNAVLLPSAALCVPRKQLRYYDHVDKPCEVGDLVYGSVKYVGFHSTLENKRGRIHVINDGSRAVFVLGNRYAPDAYEGVIPSDLPCEVDLLARSGIVGTVRNKNLNIKDPTRIDMHGYVCDKNHRVINTRDFRIIKNPRTQIKTPRRAKLILIVGASMNSGKSLTAASICWAMTSRGHKVRGCKVTGTASLKDILHMEDAGASPVADFTFFGYPSTYLLETPQLLDIFNTLDLKYANNPNNYWVVEFADGILQRETAILLLCPEVRSRIHRLVFAAHDALGAIAGVEILRSKFDLVPDAISGVCSASPLAIREMSEFADIPVVSNMQPDLNEWVTIVT